jgi:hypothetical protein
VLTLLFQRIGTSARENHQKVNPGGEQKILQGRVRNPEIRDRENSGELL